jgi:hypothetical protein
VYLKLIVAISAITAPPVCARAQNPRAVKVTKAAAENVVKIISGDKAKIRTYCDIMDLAGQFQEAEQKNDTKKTDDLSQRMDELVPELGPEYTALTDGLEDIDPNSKESTDIVSTLAALDELCAKAKSSSQP